MDVGLVRRAPDEDREFIPFAVPSIGEREIKEVVDSLQSGWISTGPKVKEFEQAIGDHVGASQAVAVSSCTAGLHLSLHALGIGPGDEVIVPTMTFCSTANVVEHLGAKPVLVDVTDEFNIDVEAAAAAVNERTKAIMPVHFAGQAVDLDDVYRLATDHGLAVVEDAAHAIDSIYGDHRIGADAAADAHPGLRRTVVFSFYATKNLTTAEGGMVVTADEGLAADIRLLSLHGMSRDAWKRYTSAGSWYYEVVAPGFKANMTDLQAAIGIHQLDRLAGFTAARQGLADRYDRALADVEGVAVPHRLPGRNHVFHLYVIKLDLDRLTIDRSGFIDELRAAQIGTSVHFIPVHLHPYYANTYHFTPADFPRASSEFERIISLPLHPGLDPQDLDYVAATVAEIARRNVA